MTQNNQANPGVQTAALMMLLVFFSYLLYQWLSRNWSEDSAVHSLELPRITKPDVINQNDELIPDSTGGMTISEIEVSSGDTLSDLFDRFGFGQSTLMMILSADESLLALETLKPGSRLMFRYQEHNAYLEEMELFIHLGHRIIYRRVAEDEFQYQTIIREGQWHVEFVNGQIDQAFYVSAQEAGLTEMEAATVTQIFHEKLNFSRAIRRGDRFQVVRSVQYVDGMVTGKTRIISARIQQRNNEFTAFLFEDGRYYDKQGGSLSRAFSRTPLAKTYRISSPFNPKRVHPVTGRVGPHNGTDFATPTGTQVLSTGDGVVSRVGNHPYAGRYVDIQHGGQYKTRYLHLQKILVKRGQAVSRGQAIALSGNSGRSTGPHLHFELHINDRPVDPMKANIPVSRSIADEDMTWFSQLVANQTRLLDAEVAGDELMMANSPEPIKNGLTFEFLLELLIRLFITHQQ